MKPPFHFINKSIFSSSDHPMNVSVSVNPKQIVEGSSANLTCHSEANPAADSYTWYKRTDTVGSDSLAYVGSGQVLSLSSMESSDSGLYVCLARNSVGEANSTGLVLVMAAEQHGLWHYSLTAGSSATLLNLKWLFLLPRQPGPSYPSWIWCISCCDVSRSIAFVLVSHHTIRS